LADLIYLKQESLARYKTLILRKYELIQECNQLKVEITRVFGDLMLAAFRVQLECLKKKKTIEFCQVYMNRNQEPDVEEMQEFVRKETATLRGYLQDMADLHEAAQRVKKTTQAEADKIRRLYRKIAKIIHPDVYPVIMESEYTDALWLMVQEAYTCNDLEILQKVDAFLSSAWIEIKEPEIADFGDKIAEVRKEIQEITENELNPYKLLLEDPEKVEARKRFLEEELESCQAYSMQLDEILLRILPEGVLVLWDSD